SKFYTCSNLSTCFLERLQYSGSLMSMNGFPPSALETGAPGGVAGHVGHPIKIVSDAAAIRANTGP
ncbi:MAG: hypothetical protein ACM3KE_14610, partial [Hyphomicrobiales bacterium]